MATWGITREECFTRSIAEHEDCWLWTRGISRGGYPDLAWGGSHVPAHRFSFELHVRPLLPGEVVKRTCRNRLCVQPTHLRAMPKRHVGLLATPSEKFCRNCGETKSAREFRKDLTRADGLFAYCKPCVTVHAFRGNLKKYGITPEDFACLLAEQGGVCAACGVEPAAGARFDVDHDHDTGRVRGLLCQPCNKTAGFSGDNADRLRQVADYLDRSRCL